MSQQIYTETAESQSCFLLSVGDWPSGIFRRVFMFLKMGLLQKLELINNTQDSEVLQRIKHNILHCSKHISTPLTDFSEQLDEKIFRLPLDQKDF